MDPELEQRIRDAYAAFVAHDLDSLRDFWHEDAVYANPPYAMEPGTREARDAVVEIRDGRVARLAWFGNRDEAAAAAGL